jgi:hypothetical protein
MITKVDTGLEKNTLNPLETIIGFSLQLIVRRKSSNFSKWNILLSKGSLKYEKMQILMIQISSNTLTKEDLVG